MKCATRCNPEQHIFFCDDCDLQPTDCLKCGNLRDLEQYIPCCDNCEPAPDAPCVVWKNTEVWEIQCDHDPANQTSMFVTTLCLEEGARDLTAADVNPDD